MQAFVGDLLPLITFAGLTQFPRLGAIKETRRGGNWRGQGVRADGETIDFDESEGSAANLGCGRVQDEAFALQHLEAEHKKINAASNAGRRPYPATESYRREY